MGAKFTKKDDEYIELVQYIMSYAKENGTLPSTKNPKYRDICNLRNGIKTGRIAEVRKSVVYIKQNFPEMIEDWEKYRRSLESKEIWNGKLNKHLLDSKLVSIINEYYPEDIYVGVKEIHDCLLVLRCRSENIKTFVLSDKTYTNLSKYIKNGDLLKLSYSDFVVLSLILYGHPKEPEYMGKSELVGNSFPCINYNNDYIELFFTLLQYPDLDTYLNDYLDNEVYMDEQIYTSDYGKVDSMRNFVCVYDYYSGKTLDATGKQFNLSRERVRQIVTRASQRLIKKYKYSVQSIVEGRIR